MGVAAATTAAAPALAQGQPELKCRLASSFPKPRHAVGRCGMGTAYINQKAWEIWKPYRSEQVLWSRIAEGGFDGFMARMYGAGKV